LVSCTVKIDTSLHYAIEVSCCKYNPRDTIDKSHQIRIFRNYLVGQSFSNQGEGSSLSPLLPLVLLT
jgi:hypothetical protein